MAYLYPCTRQDTHALLTASTLWSRAKDKIFEPVGGALPGESIDIGVRLWPISPTTQRRCVGLQLSQDRRYWHNLLSSFRTKAAIHARKCGGWTLHLQDLV